jgi:copper chaperone NosL
VNGAGAARPRSAGILSILGLLGLLILASPLVAAGKDGLTPTAKDKCPVCGMFVAKYPDWLAAVCLKEGACLFFDGAKDLFKYLQNQKKYDPSRKAEDVLTVRVRDYYDLSWIDGRKACYVLGSDVYGPMGRELIPLEKEADAKTFMNDHKGLKIMKFTDVTPEVVKALD